MNRVEFDAFLIARGRSRSPNLKGACFPFRNPIEIAIDFEELLNVPEADNVDRLATVVVNATLVIMEEFLHALNPSLNEEEVHRLDLEYTSEFLRYRIPPGTNLPPSQTFA